MQFAVCFQRVLYDLLDYHRAGNNNLSCPQAYILNPDKEERNSTTFIHTILAALRLRLISKLGKHN